MNSNSNVFDRSGLAARSDLDSLEWRKTFKLLENEQTLFLKHEAEFRSPEYSWPRDPLHNWSRVWEYPYVIYHLQGFGHDWKRATPAKVVDLGSGVTFFPFAAAKQGFDVICTDVDPICEKDLNRAIPRVEHGPGRVSFRLSNGSRLPFADGEADVVYCISVLEHIPNFGDAVREMARILKPQGLLLLTVDLDLRGDFELGVKQHQVLVRTLGEYFEFDCPDVTLHPSDVLNSINGPFGCKAPVGWRRARFLAKERIVKRILGRKPRPLVPFFLAIQGFAMVRRQRIRSEGL